MIAILFVMVILGTVIGVVTAIETKNAEVAIATIMISAFAFVMLVAGNSEFKDE